MKIKYLNLCIILSFICLGEAITARKTPPLITKQPREDELLYQVAHHADEKDRPFVIECEAKGEPQPKYKWVKNGKEFNWQSHSFRISQQPGSGTLNFTSPRDEDSGQYQCYAFNEWGTATSNTVFVRRAVFNSFKGGEVETIFAEEGKPFKLTCNPPDSWPKPIVFWMLQNHKGAMHSINSSRITVDPEGTLWFSNVTKADESSQFYYACSAHSPYRNEYKIGKRVYLKVSSTYSSGSQSEKQISPPIFQYATKNNIVVIKGEPVTLWCIVGGTPLPETQWGKTDSVLLHDRIEYDNYGKTLRIQDVDFIDEGNYFCNATNGIGTSVSHSIQVSVYTVPYFILEPQVFNIAEGNTVEFQCEAGGKPAPEIKWIHNGKPLQEASVNSRRKLIGHNIVIENAKYSDTGNYGCNATNIFGYVYKDVYLNVINNTPITDKQEKYRSGTAACFRCTTSILYLLAFSCLHLI